MATEPSLPPVTPEQLDRMCEHLQRSSDYYRRHENEPWVSGPDADDLEGE